MTESRAETDRRPGRGIEVVAESCPQSGWRNVAIVGQAGERRFSVVSDEGEYLPGGEGTAPTPLAYLVAGVAL